MPELKILRIYYNSEIQFKISEEKEFSTLHVQINTISSVDKHSVEVYV